ncbi:MAG: hypothetical protein WAX69_03485 [Victivallales bacterium]
MKAVSNQPETRSSCSRGNSKKNAVEPLAVVSAAPCGFHYSLDTIILSIRLVVFGLLSLRGAGRALDLLSAWFDGGVPCHVVVQNWIMRLGIYRLRKLKKEIMDYIEEETAGIGDKQILLGSSDIIESVFGRYKEFSGKTPMKEVG